MPVICLPSKDAADLVGPLPVPVTLTIWDGRDPKPDGLEATEFWVPEFGWATPEQQRDCFAALPALRVVQMVTAGVDSIRDQVPDGVILCDGRGVHGSATSEWVLTAILAVVRQIPRFVLARQRQEWDYAVTDELAGKRVLVVGAGDLGEQTARRLRAFDAEPVLVARSARDGVHATAELPQLLPAADVVVLVVPKTRETVGMVDAAFLARMRDGALLVNAARGPVVDTGALLAELTSGRLSAALDVTDPEPLLPGHPLWTAPNVLMTPHVGGSVRGFPRRAYTLVRQQIGRYLAGEALINVVEGDY